MHCASRRLPARAAPTPEEKQKNRATLRVAPVPAARCADTRRLNRPVQLHQLRVAPEAENHAENVILHGT
ncbi:hypothetical protein A2U01_0101262, partial [Trifolium medium]|nr:hypothetical protein [Trifolium medium]